MKRKLFISVILIVCKLSFAQNTSFFPANKATNVNPDTHLVLTFPSEPTLHNSGLICIYDAADDRLVDILDMTIPPGPHNTRTLPPYDKFYYEKFPDYSKLVSFRSRSQSDEKPSEPITYQTNYIGGTTDRDAYRFYPVIMRDNTAIICLHNHSLDYDKTYYVQIDPEVLTLADSSFTGISGKDDWTFSTKKSPPAADSKRLVVSPDGTGDFNTVQGAVDIVPDKNTEHVTIFIKNGIYDEIVYFRNKTNVTFLGEDRDKVVIGYANNGVFNPRRRAEFTVGLSKNINIVNLTLKSIGEAPAQAEALLLRGSQQTIVSHVNVHGSGDAIQVNGSVYLTDSQILGYGDNVLGGGPAFFNRCDLVSTFGPHVWVRNSQGSHGDVFLNCTFRTIGDVETVIARAPYNHGFMWPYCEAVLINCALEGLRPEGWGPVDGETENVHYWEYNSTNLSDGTPVDMSHRHPVVRQLSKDKDAEIIANYSNPAYVLGGWSPTMALIILRQPESVKTKTGQRVSFNVKVTAVPDPSCQWFKDDKAVSGATDSTLTIDNAGKTDAGNYTVTVTNELGSVTSKAATLKIQ